MSTIMRFQPFEMERWQSTWENEVDYNLSESGVHPLVLAELLDLARGDVGDTLLGYGQSNGSRELRAHIARLYPGASEANVMVTNGSAEANFVAMWQLLEAGGGAGEVVVIVPAYMQTAGLAASFGVPVRHIPLREALGWQPDPDDVAAAVTDRTRVVVVTNPNNPTGAVLDDAARRAILDAAARTGAWILADEVYTGAELDGAETRSFFGSYPRVIATGSLSKAYGLPGLRVGWVISDAETADRLWARTDYTTISPGALTDRLAALALRPDVRPRILERSRALLRDGLRTLEQWFRDRGDFRYRAPDAGAICFARYDLPVRSTDLAERLRVERSVLIVPGEHFGVDRTIRFGYGLPTHDLTAALDRVSDVLDAITATA
ncbi:MAG: aminotransferase class I/II-fold pyridoxal phosphate-dependent enzyme [Longimicrobiales bacterium]